MKFKPFVILALVVLLLLLFWNETAYHARAHSEKTQSAFVTFVSCGINEKVSGIYIDQKVAIKRAAILAVTAHDLGSKTPRLDCSTILVSNGSKMFVYGSPVNVLDRLDPARQSIEKKAN